MSDTTERVYTESMERDIAERLGFDHAYDDWDWWLPGGNPQLTWAELIEWAIRILSAEATKAHYPDAYLDVAPVYAVNAGAELPVTRVRGAKRVNAVRGEYRDYTGAMGFDYLINPARAQAIVANPPRRDSGDRFRLHGKDEGCEVEGSWHDWICFAHNILASENTRIACPELYRPELANNNY